MANLRSHLLHVIHPALANMLAQVLCHKNHPRIRIFGFRLLLLWINDQTVEYPEAIYLFSNAISLDLFMYDGEDLTIDHASSSQTRLPPMSNGSTGRRSAKHVSQYLDLVHVNLNQELLLCKHLTRYSFDAVFDTFFFFVMLVFMFIFMFACMVISREINHQSSWYPLVH